MGRFAALALLAAACARCAAETLPSAVVSSRVEFADIERLTPRARKGEVKLVQTGSGFCVDEFGRVLTNEHVIEGADEIVMVCAGVAYRMKVVRRNREKDLALLALDGVAQPLAGARIDTGRVAFPSVVFRAKPACEVGESVYVVGYPQIGVQGLESKVTRGIVSSASGFRGESGCFQMDASIQPGNSGGPVFDARGRLVGVVVATLRGSQNVNYAITAAAARAFLPKDVTANLGAPPKHEAEVEMVRRVRSSAVLVLAYAEEDRSYLAELDDVRERNEARTQIQKAVVLARLHKLRRNWAELKDVTEGLIGMGEDDGEIREMNELAREELGEHLVVVAEAGGHDVPARIRTRDGFRDAYVRCGVPLALEDRDRKRGFPIRADLEYADDEGVWRGKLDEIYDWRGTREVRVVLKRVDPETATEGKGEGRKQ